MVKVEFRVVTKLQILLKKLAEREGAGFLMALQEPGTGIQLFLSSSFFYWPAPCRPGPNPFQRLRWNIQPTGAVVARRTS
jgi:hypothetical protein